MAWIGALTGAMGASSSGVGANLATGYYNRSQSNKAYQRQKNAMKSRYQWTMGDMKAAGLNPILAYQQGSSGGVSVPQSSMSGVHGPDVMSSAREGAQIAQNMRDWNLDKEAKAQNIHNMKAQEKNILNSTENFKANTAKSLAEARGVEIDNMLKGNELNRSHAWSSLYEKVRQELPGLFHNLDEFPQAINSGKRAREWLFDNIDKGVDAFLGRKADPDKR